MIDKAYTNQQRIAAIAKAQAGLDGLLAMDTTTLTVDQRLELEKSRLYYLQLIEHLTYDYDHKPKGKRKKVKVSKSLTRKIEKAENFG